MFIILLFKKMKKVGQGGGYSPHRPPLVSAPAEGGPLGHPLIRTRNSPDLIRARVNLRPAMLGCVCLNTPLRFFAVSKKTAARSATEFSPTLTPIFLATFLKCLILGHARSGHQVR